MSDFAGKTVLIVNPAAAGGRCARRVGPWVARMEAAGLQTRVVRTTGPGHATQLAREAAEGGAGRVVAVGGDGTLHEVANGLVHTSPTPLGILPLGTGNSFARDFGLDDPQAAFDALCAGQTRAIDLLRIEHDHGELHSINLVSLGFVANVGELTNRRFKALGPLGYVAATVVCVARLHSPVTPVGADDGPLDRRPAVFLCFCNSQFTGGAMQMAPGADPSDGQLDVIRVGPMGRGRLLRLFPKIFQGTHTEAPEIEASRATSVRFELAAPIATLVDGEALMLRISAIHTVPGALKLVVP